MNHQQQQIIDYLGEENRILHARLGTRRLRFDDEQRRRLAVRAKLLGRRVLAEVATIVTPDTIVRMATENRDWGYRRIQAALSNLGHIVARGTVANILKKHVFDPTPQRNRQTSWKEFLSRHWELIVAAYR